MPIVHVSMAIAIATAAAIPVSMVLAPTVKVLPLAPSPHSSPSLLLFLLSCVVCFCDLSILPYRVVGCVCFALSLAVFVL